MELVTVKNLHPTIPLPLPHDALGDVLLQPNQSKILPTDYVNVYFGNPAARDVGKDKARSETFKRCRVMWGYYAGMEPESVWEATKPQFEVRTLDGERVWTVIEDPLGTKVTPDLTTDFNEDPRFVHARIAELTQQIERLTSIVAQQTGTTSATRSAEQVTHDQIAQAMENVLTQDRVEPGEVGVIDTSDTAALDTGMIPAPPTTEAPVTTDKPRTPRAGPRVR